MEVRPTNLASSGAEKIVNRLNELSGGKILDVGTGNGGFIDFLRQALGSYDSFIGIDLDEKELKKAKKRYGEIAEFKKMNAEKLEFPDNSVDIASIASSLHHLEKPEKVLKEMIRVVKPQGYLIIQEMYSDPDQTEAQLATIATHHFGARVDTLLEREYHRETYTREEIKELVRSVEPEEIEVFDSTRYPGCLFCEDREKCDNPMDEELIKSQIKDLRSTLKKVDNHPADEEFEKVEKRLEQRIRKNGSSDASVLFILVKKQ
ncbi:MAG: class I SAM-dependent methyltransferase [Asgard group archaeon]|nr:class I SAM-dependent methyltransferase [Asgard group archaeon]